MNGPEAGAGLKVALHDLTEEVASNAYAPEFEHMGPLVIAARTALAAHDQLTSAIDGQHENLKPAQPETLARAEVTGPGVDFLQTVKEAAVAMAQHMPDKRETHALFAALSDHTGTDPLSRAEKDRLTALERDAIALQFGDYLASAADRLLSAIAAEDVARDAAISASVLPAMETRVDCSTKVEREIYEYRKRRRAQSGG